ncbi:MAG: hypothetical protein KJ569_07985 [Candidatus Omnitrophica bacterium]|nr:hypothetical protein [Candidatus Omnitrophota bacterium]
MKKKYVKPEIKTYLLKEIDPADHDPKVMVAVMEMTKEWPRPELISN